MIKKRKEKENNILNIIYIFLKQGIFDNNENEELFMILLIKQIPNQKQIYNFNVVGRSD